MPIWPTERVQDWMARLRGARRARDLRRRYTAMVLEEPRSLDDRVAFHLHHLGLYWSRASGIFAQLSAPSQSFVSHALVQMPLVASEEAERDIYEYCDLRTAEELRARWHAYCDALEPLRRGKAPVAEALAAAKHAFVAVTQAFEQLHVSRTRG